MKKAILFLSMSVILFCTYAEPGGLGKQGMKDFSTNENMDKPKVKLGIEVATKEIYGWLDYKKIGDQRRESNTETINRLIDAVAEGVLVVKSDQTLVHTLKFPSETAEAPIKTLEYKPRIRIRQIRQHLTGVKAGDADGRLDAYIAALASVPKAVLLDLDSEDYAVAQSVAIFFV